MPQDISRVRAIGGGHNFLVDEFLLLSLHTLPGESRVRWRHSTGKWWWTASVVPDTPLPDRGEEDKEALTLEDAGISYLCNIGEEAFLQLDRAILHISPAKYNEKPMNQQHSDMWARIEDLSMVLNVAHDGKYFVLYTEVP